MYNINLNQVKDIVSDILSKHTIENVAFVGCGASKSELYPAKYFLANASKKLIPDIRKPANVARRSPTFV